MEVTESKSIVLHGFKNVQYIPYIDEGLEGNLVQEGGDVGNNKQSDTEEQISGVQLTSIDISKSTEELSQDIVDEELNGDQSDQNLETSSSPASSPGLKNKNMFLLSGRNLNVARTVVYYGMFAILGLNMSIVGPTLMDLRHSSRTDSYSISFLFTARSVGYLAGALTGGVLLDYIKNEQMALIVSSAVVATGAYVIPWCRSLSFLLTTFAVAGFAMGICNTGSNVCCLRIWGKKGAPFLQGLHFAYGLGGFMAPLLAAPFLSEQTPMAGGLSLMGGSHNITTETSQNTTDKALEITPSHKYSAIFVPYSIIGALAFMVCASLIFVMIVSSNEKSSVEEDEQVRVRDPGLTFTVIVVILACLQTGLISGVEVSFAQMLTSYVVKSSHHLSKSTGSYMTSVYWGTFTLTRAVSIGLTCKIRVQYLLIFDLILSVASAIVLLTLGTWSVHALWIGTGMLGIGVASIFPATLSWVEKYININNRIASAFTLVSSILEMTVPLVISMYLGSQPNVLFHFVTAATISSCLLFITLNIILTRKGEKYMTEETPTGENGESQSPPASV